MSSVITATANPREGAALFRLDLLTSNELVSLCEKWLVTGLDGGSADVAWLASQTLPIMSELEKPFERALASLVGPLPTIDEAARTAIRLYVRAIADGAVPTQAGMKALVEDLDHKFSAGAPPLIASPDREPGDPNIYAGTALGIDHLYTWYRELQDAQDGSMLFYYNDLPREQQLAKFSEELRAAAGRLAAHLERDGAVALG